MPIPEELLHLLRCPETRQPLVPAAGDALARIRESSGGSIEAALIREDGRRAYPVRGGFPILLLEEAIEIARV